MGRTTGSRVSRRACAAVFASLALVGTTAAATMSTLYTLDTDETITQISGGSSGWVDWVSPSGGTNYQALYEISMWEDGDSPCRLQIRSRHLNTYVGKNTVWDESQCDENAGSIKTLTFSNSDTYIRGINVCLNNAGTRVKGMRLYGTKLDRATGQLDHLTGYKQWTRPNCNGNWQTIRYCPAGKVARALKLEFRAQQFIGDEIQGIRLVCRSVIPA